MRPIITTPRSILIILLALLGQGCSPKLVLEDRACPCAAGYVCCEAIGQCLTSAQRCPVDGAAGAAAPADATGDSPTNTGVADAGIGVPEVAPPAAEVATPATLAPDALAAADVKPDDGAATAPPTTPEQPTSPSDGSSCGPARVQCPAAPAHGTATCVGGQCDFACHEVGRAVKCNGRCVQCCDRSACGAAESCINNECRCEGIMCGTRCVGKKVLCAVLIRSQGPDQCSPLGDPVGCRAPGPVDDLSECRIGVMRRQLVAPELACDFEALGRGACRTYICQNRQPGLDVAAPIVVSNIRDEFDDRGYVSGGSNPSNTTCQILGVTACDPASP